MQELQGGLGTSLDLTLMGKPVVTILDILYHYHRMEQSLQSGHQLTTEPEEPVPDILEFMVIPGLRVLLAGFGPR